MKNPAATLAGIAIMFLAGSMAFADASIIPTLATPQSVPAEWELAKVDGVSGSPVPISSPAESLFPEEAVVRIAEECQTGSLIFSRGDCLAVKAYTGSGYTHVATVVEEHGDIYVYDSMNGVGVRRLSLVEYLETQSPDHVVLFHPVRTFEQHESESFESALAAELGRPYSVSHHLTGRRCEGLHCSEYVTDALISIDWIHADNPVRVSPASLMEGIVLHDVYVEGSTFLLPRPIAPIPEPDSWCGQLWQDTKQCTLNSCRQLSRWILCR